jgi:CheY-like chemotaxis protein
MVRVLIVDDSEDLLDAYRDTLTSKGYDVAVALDGEEGLERVRELRPDIVVLDMMMPGIDGLEFLARLPSACPSPLPRVIANSGFDTYRAEALRRGAHSFLRKPVTLNVLVAAITAAAPGEPVPADKLAENEEQVRISRQKSQSAAESLVAKLADDRMRTIQTSLDALVYWLHRYYGFGGCFLHLIDGDNLYLQACFGSDPHYLAAGMRYPRNNVYCGNVIDAGSTLYVSNPLHHPVEDFSLHNEVRGYSWNFYIGAPLTTKDGAVLGTLCLMDRTPRQMHQEDIRLFEALAMQVAAMLAGVADGRTGVPAVLDSERVYHRDALDLLICTGVRRATRTRGRVQVARLRLRDREDYASVVRKAYGITSGLRFAMASTGGDLVLVHDGEDHAIVTNNVNALHQMIAPALSSFQTVGWAPSATPTTREEPMTTAAAHAITARLLDRLGIGAAANR